MCIKYMRVTFRNNPNNFPKYSPNIIQKHFQYAIMEVSKRI